MRGTRQILTVVMTVQAACATVAPEMHKGDVPAEAEASVTATTVDTATEVALYGLVSWAYSKDDDDEPIVALMPDASAGEPECLGKEDAPDNHFPVLKIVTGDFSWTGNPLPHPLSQTNPRIFSLAGQDVTIEEAGGFETLAKVAFDLLSSDTSLNKTKSATITAVQQAKLRSTLLNDILASDTHLGARVRFTQGHATASIDSSCHPQDPVRYLAEQNTKIDIGQGEPDCPTPGSTLVPKTLAEEMVVRLKDTPATLKVRFRDWWTGERRTLTVEPASAGVRIEMSNQMESAAEFLDSRHEDLCEHPVHLQDYLWYYDLRNERDCPIPTLFPCDPTGAGGTKCPEHGWGG